MLGDLELGIRIDERMTGRPLFQTAPGVKSAVEFDRQANDTSVAKAVFAAPPHVVNALEPWRFMVSIYDRDTLVWHGPLTSVQARRSGVTIGARDGSIYWDRRRVGQPRHYVNADAALVMRDLVTDAMSKDDPARLVPYMRSWATELWVTKDIIAGTRMMMEEVGELESLGLQWTVSAGRLLIGPLASQWRTETLTDDVMDAEVIVEKDGLEVVTDVLVQGSGVYGYHIDAEQACGILQSIEKADSLVREEECRQLGYRMVEEAKYAPRRVILDGDARLLPEAPMKLEELVPGVIVPVSSSQTGVTVSAEMMIKSVSVSATSSGTSVSLSLMEPPAALDPLLAPKQVEPDYHSPYDREARSKEQTMPRNDSEQRTGDFDGQAPVV